MSIRSLPDDLGPAVASFFMRLIAAAATASSLVAAKLIGLISTFTLGHPCCGSRYSAATLLPLLARPSPVAALATPCPVSVAFEKFALLYASPATSLAMAATAAGGGRGRFYFFLFRF